MWNLRADDRVLSLAIPAYRDTAAIGRILSAGCLVAFGDRDEVDEARRLFSEFDNLMFLETSFEGIPWRNAFFTKILIPPHMTELAAALGADLQRVLAPGGEIVTTSENA
jgi:hypothetical protein